VSRECWKPSAGWLAVTAVQGLVGLGLFFVLIRFFFPRAFLIPVLVITGVFVVSGLFMTRMRVVLDREAGTVTIAAGWWSRHVPLTQVKRVDESRRFGAWIDIADGTGYGFGPSRRYRWLKSLLRIRTGFEGMEPAITQAAAAARAADPERAAAQDAASRRARDRHGVPMAAALCAGGLLGLAAAAVVQPQAGGWLVHGLAVLLRIYCGLAGMVFVLVGAWWLYGTWRDRRMRRKNGTAGAG
jgi:hypothetical protein